MQAELESCRSRQTPEETRAAWLNWWESADAGLRSLFADTDLVAALLQSRAEISRMNPAARPLGFLHREISVWAERFGEEIRLLNSLKLFIEVQGQIVVPDTSAFIDGPYFAQFDWVSLDSLTLAAGSVRLVVPILVIEELDTLRGDRDRRVSGRARSVLRMLWELHATSPMQPALLPGAPVTVEVFLDDPWHVRRPINGDEIIERALAIQAITGKALLLAAADNAMLYRAAAAGLKAILVPRHDQDESRQASPVAAGHVPADPAAPGRSPVPSPQAP